MQSFKKKIVSLVNNGLDPLLEGKHNFENESAEIEKLALQRLEICKSCVFFEEEPINFLRVIDDRIESLSNKMCGECGCTLSYKLRQSKTKCEKWLK